MCTSTHFFLGANSGRGFQSLFDRFCEPADFGDLLVLKGSAACGKSTMMRRIGEAVEERGEEYFQPRECLAPLLRYVEEHRVAVAGSPISRPFLSLNKKENYTRFREVWLPVRG